VFVALGVAAAVGISRVYLRAHWWSDVVGGWGLAAAIFSLLAGIALVVDHFRHNGERRARESRESAVARGA
jgi:membrane-associated phospholipid phosphatase